MQASIATALALAFSSPSLPSGLAPSPDGQAPSLELVESAPVGTTLDAPDLRDAHTVWVERIDASTRRIDLAHFYASEAPEALVEPGQPSRLTPVVEALERAAARGVAIRLLLSENFRETYPATAERLAAEPGVELRWLDLRPRTGGVLHAKYMLFDERGLFVGSQNFDWRALEHIQELGIAAEHPSLARAFGRLFELDWQLAGGATLELAGAAPHEPLEPVEIDGARVTPVFSPVGLLPAGLEWDLPHILRLIDAAERTVRVQLLSYSPTDRDGGWFGELDNALRRAAARGVEVRLILADWAKRQGRIEWLQSLEPLPNLSVRLVSVPPAEQGFIPFARCVHAKYLVVDADAGWLGTSNWSGDYFYASRNAGLVVEGGTLPERLDRFHADTWNSPYAFAVDPGADYVAPRIGE